MTRKPFFFFFCTTPSFPFEKWACEEEFGACNCGSHSVTMRKAFPNMLRMEVRKHRKILESSKILLSPKTILPIEDFLLCKK